MTPDQLKALVLDSLDDLKAINVTCLDVKNFSSMTDYMVIATGTSRRHVGSMADSLILNAKKSGVQPTGVEGMESADWVLVDLGDVVANIMMSDTREFYGLEKIWSNPPSSDNKDQVESDTPAVAGKETP